MSMHVITKVYEVRQSSRGGSNTYCMYFSKEKALECARVLESEMKELGYSIHFRVYEHTTTDALVYSD